MHVPSSLRVSFALPEEILPSPILFLVFSSPISVKMGRADNSSSSSSHFFPHSPVFAGGVGGRGGSFRRLEDDLSPVFVHLDDATRAKVEFCRREKKGESFFTTCFHKGPLCSLGYS